MKAFVSVVLLAALVAAEPPLYRDTRFGYARQEVELSNGGDSKSTGGAPYPAAGFKPDKEFKLPVRQELTPPSTNYGVPDSSYGAPLNTISAPQTEYGVPKAENKSTEGGNTKDDDTEIVESADNRTAKGEAKSANKESGKNAKLEDASQDEAVINARGVYYVLLPGSQLQRVQFQTENDLANMAYTARLQYKNEDRAPIYLYTAVPQQYSAPISAAYYQPSYQPRAAVATAAAYIQRW